MFHVLVDSGSNTWGYVPRDDGAPTTRVPRQVRWTGVLAECLGGRFEVIEDGLNLRTTDLDGNASAEKGIRPDTVNGAFHLPTAIVANMPLDWVIIMLGSNNLQERYARSPEEVAAAAVEPARTVQALEGGIGMSYPAPKALLITPPPMSLMPIGDWAIRFAEAAAKSRDLAPTFAQAAAAHGVSLIDAGELIGGHVHGVDGVHLSVEDHNLLGRGIAKTLLKLAGMDELRPQQPRPGL